jgi:hypothetical protein
MLHPAAWQSATILWDRLSRRDIFRTVTIDAATLQTLGSVCLLGGFGSTREEALFSPVQPSRSPVLSNNLQWMRFRCFVLIQMVSLEQSLTFPFLNNDD